MKLASFASCPSSDGLRKWAWLQTGEPSQPLMRRSTAQVLCRPSSPTINRPPGFRTRAISFRATAASSTKQSTVTAVTTSKLPGSKGRFSACAISKVISFPCSFVRFRAAAIMRSEKSTPTACAPRLESSIVRMPSPHPTSRMRRPAGGPTRSRMRSCSTASVIRPSTLRRQAAYAAGSASKSWRLPRSAAVTRRPRCRLRRASW